MLVNLEISPIIKNQKRIKPAAKESIWRTEKMQQVLPWQLASAKTWLGLKDWKTLKDLLISWDSATSLPGAVFQRAMSVVSGISGFVLPCFTTMPMVCRAGYTLRWDLCWDRVPMRCQGKFLVGCDGGRSNVRCGARIRWPLDSLGSGWDDYRLKRKVIDGGFNDVHILQNSQFRFGGKRIVPFRLICIDMSQFRVKS